MKKVLAILLLALAGCATTPAPVVQDRVVSLPKPPVIATPVLGQASTGQEKAQALAIYIAQLKAALAQALEALKAYE